MKLLIIGTLEGHMTGASQIAIQRGAKVAAVDAIDQGLEHLRNGKGADVVLIDVRLNIERLCKALLAERIGTFAPLKSRRWLLQLIRTARRPARAVLGRKWQ